MIRKIELLVVKTIRGIKFFPGIYFVGEYYNGVRICERGAKALIAQGVARAVE